jgi:hypothetical protein
MYIHTYMCTSRQTMCIEVHCRLRTQRGYHIWRTGHCGVGNGRDGGLCTPACSWQKRGGRDLDRDPTPFFFGFLRGSIFIPALQMGQYDFTGRFEDRPGKAGMTGLSICIYISGGGAAVCLLCLHAARPEYPETRWAAGSVWFVRVAGLSG